MNTTTQDDLDHAISGAADSTLEDGTLQAYIKAEYQVLATPPFTLHVGKISSELQALFLATQTNSAAFVTPYNPFGHLLSAHENRLRLQELEATLAQSGLKALRVKGLDPEGKWPEEEGVLILGIARDAAMKVGRDYKQNAILWCGETGFVQLVVLV